MHPTYKREMNRFIMPWGKYRGSDLYFLPSAYLYWLAVECKDAKISELADEEWQYREKYNCHRGRPKYYNMEND